MFGGGLFVTAAMGCQCLRLSRPSEIETFTQEDHAGPEPLGKSIEDERSHRCHRCPDRQLFIWSDRGEHLQPKVSNDGKSKRETEIDINRTKPLAGFAFESFVARGATFVHGRNRLKKSSMTAARTAEAIATPEDIDELPKHRPGSLLRSYLSTRLMFVLGGVIGKRESCID